MPEDRLAVGAPAAVSHLRPRRLLRFLAEQARPAPRIRGRPPDRSVLPSGRGLALVLLRRDVRVSATDQAPLAETPDLHGAFPRLSDEQIGMLERCAERRRTQPGEVLFREGDERYDFYVVREGLVAVVSGYGGDERPIAVHGPGRFL